MNVVDRFANADMYEKTYNPKKMTQKQACLDYLEKYGSITPLEALTAFHSFRLAAIIFELRKDGYAINTGLSETEPRYAIYTLVENNVENSENMTWTDYLGAEEGEENNG